MRSARDAINPSRWRKQDKQDDVSKESHRASRVLSPTKIFSNIRAGVEDIGDRLRPNFNFKKKDSTRIKNLTIYRNRKSFCYRLFR
jgi:hypothetical protein